MFAWGAVWFCSLLRELFFWMMRHDMPCGGKYLWHQTYMNRGMYFYSLSKFHFLCSSLSPTYRSPLPMLWLRNHERPADYLSPLRVLRSTLTQIRNFVWFVQESQGSYTWRYCRQNAHIRLALGLFFFITSSRSQSLNIFHWIYSVVQVCN